MEGRKKMRKEIKRKLLVRGMAAAAALLLAGCGNGLGSVPEDLEDGMAPGAGERVEERNGSEEPVSQNGLEEPGERNGSEDLEYRENPESKRQEGLGISEAYVYSGDGVGAATDFAVRLLKQTMEQEGSVETDGNILISPLSVASALAMTANGAKGETLVQMEEAFSISASELSLWLRAYREALPSDEKYQLSMADSIWFTEDERFTVEQDFLQVNADYFDAEVYKVPFDGSTVSEINGWVERNTDGMIPEILSQIPPEAVMYLVNALAFDAEWQSIYREDLVREGMFTKEDGTVQKAEMMYSEEQMYLTDGRAEGFLKYYADAKYAFAALLPGEGMTVSEYIASLTGEGLRKMLNHPQECCVSAGIPKYEMEYGIEMNDILKSMGVIQAFDEGQADLSGIGFSTEGNIYISKVIHKTFMAVDERGTKAGAATAVETVDSASVSVQESKTVHLNRPFVCMILDTEQMVPVFIGVVKEMPE